MFDALSDKLQRVFSRLSSHGTVTEKDLDEALREVRVALLEADVNSRVVREFINAIRERALAAGYLQLDEDVVEEIQSLETSFQPHETLLVVDAMTGQEAVHVAEEFGKATKVTGFVLTKLDGGARGGAAPSIP